MTMTTHMCSAHTPPVTTLGDLLGRWSDLPAAQARVEICGLTDDSRTVESGQAFVAMPGQGRRHGWEFASRALAAGARAVIADTEPPSDQRVQLERAGATWVCVNGLGAIAPALYSRAYPLAPGQMKIIAVTGTNGKSTVVELLRQLLPDCATMGTLGVNFAGSVEELALTTTTLAGHCQHLYRLQKLGARYVALEASSIGLAQGRLDAVPVDIAVLTGISRDHLDYHADMDEYAAAKFKLFTDRCLEAAVVNTGDPRGRQLADRVQQPACFQYQVFPGAIEGEEPDYSAFELSFDEDGVRFSLSDKHTGEVNSCHSALMCAHNVENLLATLTVALSLNEPLAALLEKLPTLHPCPGRTEIYRLRDNRLVVIDYAHTPDALDRLLGGLHLHGHDSISVVFGCGGGRDKGKRPLMAETVARYAARIIVTSDNPREENPDDIIADILQGFPAGCVSPEVTGDRRQAIASALAGDDDNLIVIAGRGCERRQLTAAGAVDFVDLDVVKNFDSTLPVPNGATASPGS